MFNINKTINENVTTKYIQKVIQLYLIICCQCYNANVIKLRTSKKFNRILGGIDGEIIKYPWIAQVLYDKKSHCGGVVITSTAVLTACHCVFDDDDKVLKPKHLSILVGSSEELIGNEYKSKKIKPHPKYLNRDLPYYFFDIAIIFLKKNIKFSNKVKPAQIAPHSSWKRQWHTMIVAGFGATSNDSEEEEEPKQLQITRMRFVDRRLCIKSENNMIGRKMPVPPHMFCMIGDTATSDCHGDSGSGVMWEGFVVGLVSAGRTITCGSLTAPSMYVDLTFFKDWIQESISEEA